MCQFFCTVSSCYFENGMHYPCPLRVVLLLHKMVKSTKSVKTYIILELFVQHNNIWVIFIVSCWRIYNMYIYKQISNAGVFYLCPISWWHLSRRRHDKQTCYTYVCACRSVSKLVVVHCVYCKESITLQLATRYNNLMHDLFTWFQAQRRRRIKERYATSQRGDNRNTIWEQWRVALA